MESTTEDYYLVNNSSLTIGFKSKLIEDQEALNKIKAGKTRSTMDYLIILTL